MRTQRSAGIATYRHGGKQRRAMQPFVLVQRVVVGCAAPHVSRWDMAVSFART